MLTHAFEVWGVRRVVFRTDARNARSIANIERVGATYEGTLRLHMFAADGDAFSLRDTATFSIIHDEWEAIKVALTARLS